MPAVAIAASSSGDNTVVAAVTGKKIQVLGWWLSCSGTVNAKWRSGSTDVSGLLYGVANSGISCPPIATGNVIKPWVETAVGAALVLNLSGAVPVGGQVYYELA